jgi:hypothetical protein
MDACGQCAGGTTGITPVTDENLCGMTGVAANELNEFSITPNPTSGIVRITAGNQEPYRYTVWNGLGQELISTTHVGNTDFNLTAQPSGFYYVRILQQDGQRSEKIMKE